VISLCRPFISLTHDLDHPKPRARRTFTLIAKSLQGLANMSSFGTKEAWMEPMNSFLTTHRQEFKKYLDDICSVSTTSPAAVPIPPSYSTPIAILHRLPPTFKEGFPSLPYLIDHSRNFAMLVNLWLECSEKYAQHIQASDGDLLRFHNICVSLSERTKDCLARAEPAERPSSSLSVKWEELVEQLQGTSIESGRGAATRNRSAIREEEDEMPPMSPNGEDASSSSASTPITMKPPPKTRHQQHPSISASASSLKSNSSVTISQTNPYSSQSWAARYAPSPHESTSQSASASASASVSAAEETPPGSSDGLHMAPAPSYPQTLSQPASSQGAFNYSNPNVHINMSNLPNTSAGRPPRSSGGISVEGSESGSVLEEEYTTALPVWSSKEKEGKDKEKRERGLRGVLPFPRKRRDKDKDKDKDKEKDKGKDRDRSAERSGRDRSGSALGEYSNLGSLRGKNSHKDRNGKVDRDEDF
jgi:hypothetical protein